MILKFSRDGTFLKQLGSKYGRGTPGGNEDVVNFNRPSEVVVDPRTNEVYIADGYGNQRVLVLDAATGVFKRMWGGFGYPPPKTNGSDPMTSFGHTVHGISLTSAADLLYVGDRDNNRFQVFAPNGTFVRERSAPEVWDFSFSADPAQAFMYVTEGSLRTVRIYNRLTLEDLATFGGLSPAGTNL